MTTANELLSSIINTGPALSKETHQVPGNAKVPWFCKLSTSCFLLAVPELPRFEACSVTLDL